MSLPLLVQTARQFGRDDVPEAAFEDYLACILNENEAYGLTALKVAGEVELQLLADALAFFGAPHRPDGPVVDLGSGAGIPGIPLALADARLHVTLVESRQRKAQFLSRMAARLKLGHRVRVIAERAEDLGQNPEFREKFAMAVAKGLAPLPILLELALPLVQPWGLLLAWKGPGAADEIEKSRNALQVLHAEVEGLFPYTLPTDDATRQLVLIRKKAATPKDYPRRAGIPKKSPL